MPNLDDKINELKKLLDENMITEKKYNKEIAKLMTEGTTTKKNIFSSINIINVMFNLFIILIILIFISIFNSGSIVKKNTEYVSSLSDIRAPIQKQASGSAKKTIGDTDFYIQYIASYDIEGYVVNVKGYVGYNANEKLSPIDVGISWGFLANQKYRNKVSWYSYSNRYLHCKFSPELFQEFGEDKINQSFSNNHLIPANSKIEKLIKKIKEKDYIRIKGYLVSVYEGNSPADDSLPWSSSTTRNDSGNRACEIIYVTDLKWLKLKD